MREIDLIPPEYRRSRWRTVWLRNWMLAVAMITLVSFAAFAALTIQVDRIRKEKRLLEERLAVTAQQREDLESLDRRKNDLNQQLTMLNSLRSGAPARAVFLAIDRALADAEVWFLDWQFRRAGVMVPESQAAGVQTGYFIVVPESGHDGGEQAWLVETHMKITGQARDHEALSRFVNGLYAQSAVVDVKVQRTERNRRNSRDLVKFEVAIVLASEAKG